LAAYCEYAHLYAKHCDASKIRCVNHASLLGNVVFMNDLDAIYVSQKGDL